MKLIIATILCTVFSCWYLPEEISHLQSIESTTIYDEGFALFKGSLDEWDVLGYYSNDRNYLQNFPFSSYTIHTVPGQGMFYLDNINDCIKGFLRNHQIWEESNIDLMEKYIKPGTIAIDIGAHIGSHTVTMSRCVGSKGTVVAFEPQHKIFRELCMNLSLNDCENVYPIRCALGKERKIVTLVHPLADNEGATFIKDGSGGDDVPLVTLDSFQLSNVSFIKIDTENTEGDVIDGAIETIKRNRPVMIIEIQGNTVRADMLGEDIQKLKQENIEKIENLGYELRFLGFDYLALPKSL